VKKMTSILSEEILLDECMKDVLQIFEKHRVFPTSDNIVQLTDTLFKAKKWGSTKFKG
jgi:hypothetical protein